jgi:hypothetical protein
MGEGGVVRPCLFLTSAAPVNQLCVIAPVRWAPVLSYVWEKEDADAGTTAR